MIIDHLNPDDECDESYSSAHDYPWSVREFQRFFVYSQKSTSVVYWLIRRALSELDNNKIKGFLQEKGADWIEWKRTTVV